jgi:hypothetical protein
VVGCRMCAGAKVTFFYSLFGGMTVRDERYLSVGLFCVEILREEDRNRWNLFGRGSLYRAI